MFNKVLFIKNCISEIIYHKTFSSESLRMNIFHKLERNSNQWKVVFHRVIVNLTNSLTNFILIIKQVILNFYILLNGYGKIILKSVSST